MKAAHRNALDHEPRPRAVIRLDEHTDGVRACHPRRRADAALEAVADHPGAASDVALVHRTVRGRVERRSRVLGADVEPVHVVEDAVPRLGDYRQAPGAAVAGERGRHKGFVDGADRMRVRQRDRRGQQPRLLHPLQARDLAVAVEPERRGEGW